MLGMDSDVGSGGGVRARRRRGACRRAGGARGGGAAAAGAPGPRAVIPRPADARARPGTRTCPARTAGT